MVGPVASRMVRISSLVPALTGDSRSTPAPVRVPVGAGRAVRRSIVGPRRRQYTKRADGQAQDRRAQQAERHVQLGESDLVPQRLDLVGDVGDRGGRLLVVVLEQLRGRRRAQRRERVAGGDGLGDVGVVGENGLQRGHVGEHGLGTHPLGGADVDLGAGRRLDTGGALERQDVLQRDRLRRDLRERGEVVRR